MLSHYAMLHGRPFLREVLMPTIDDVLLRVRAIEIDENRVDVAKSVALSGDDAKIAQVRLNIYFTYYY